MIGTLRDAGTGIAPPRRPRAGEWLDARTDNAHTGRWDRLARNAAQTAVLIAARF
ncbi:hypothetical protein [Kutzneria kofuensis]|uniref:Uncharacterized protein n=1 Tax=Kutzneria kofuensis TaxID=103725 RepID=A0A7W9KAM3_9PSEU|nr:hypothetical protein [Kutzneria kofuensis]MBB5889107.1 hypothetical protein [Kutzneria kofuensis]